MKQYLIAEETRDQLIDLIEQAGADFIQLERELGDKPEAKLSPARRSAMRLTSVLPHLKTAPEAPASLAQDERAAVMDLISDVFNDPNYPPIDPETLAALSNAKRKLREENAQ